MWRKAISQGARTLKHWIDPNDEAGEPGDNDVLTGVGEIHLQTNFDPVHDRSMRQLLFGRHAQTMVAGIEVDPSQCVEKLRKSFANLRHESFHFKGRRGFVGRIVAAMNTDDQKAIQRDRALADNDLMEYGGRLRRVLRGAKVEQYVKQSDLSKLVSSLSIEENDSDIVLPKFNRVLQRATNAPQTL